MLGKRDGREERIDNPSTTGEDLPVVLSTNSIHLAGSYLDVVSREPQAFTTILSYIDGSDIMKV